MNLSSAASPRNSTQEIHWTEDLESALVAARNSNKPLMLHFYGDHCPPCKMLEKKAFRDAKLIEALNANVIAVRINADQDRRTAQRYQVNRWPTDVYLLPNGDELDRGVSNQDPATYSKTVERIAIRHRDWTLEQVAQREAKQRREAQSTAMRPSGVKTKISAETYKNPTPVRIQASTWSQSTESTTGSAQSDAPPPARSDAPPMANPFAREASPSDASRHASQLAALESVPGLGGFCPVSLQTSAEAASRGEAAGSAWVPGSPAFGVRHRGRIYHCVSETARQTLLQDPDRYTPVLSGCDLVEFARSGDLVDGNHQFGFIEQRTGRIFLFATRSNFEEFSRNCEAYSPMLGEPKERVANESTPAIQR